MTKKAIIIGAGPAGLTAAYELLKRTDIKPIILEKSGDIGGISKTINYKGNRIDIGGHRFFSKSDRVMEWWMNMMPIQADENDSVTIAYQNKTRQVDLPGGDKTEADSDKVMLVRQRLSRIYFLRKFFTYPIQLSIDTLTKLGVIRTIAIMVSYLAAQIFPRKPERNLEDFMINRFGKVLYKLFFKDYTEKVWGKPCAEISAEWGAQRIKGVSISKAIQHAIQSATKKKKKANGIAQKDTETSLIEQFLYPKHGPGQLWEEVARQIEEMGGKILMHHDVKRIYTAEENEKISAVATINNLTGETSYLEGDYFFSTMPVQELIGGMDGTIPEEVAKVASGLQYRDFITVGILLKKLSFQDNKTGEWKPLTLKDTWIYIQEKDVVVGRLQIFNNWSPFMVKDPDTVWVGMEYFCNEGDSIWQMPDEAIKNLAITELEKIGLATKANVLDATVIKMLKTYPAYFGSYEHFDVIRQYVDQFKNLFLVGRNGMHKYNNSDHSMLTAMVSVDNIASGITSKENIWSINTEMEYHEEKITTNGTTPAPIKEKNNPTIPLSWSFKDYIFKNPAHEMFVWVGVIGIIVQLCIFKMLYPFASFINGDSYVYINAAYQNYDFNTYPIGYSKFLRLFSIFSKSDTALVAFQYLVLQMAINAFLFTLFYFCNSSKWTKIILFGFMLFNPIFLHLANYVSSDAIFLTLSILWFTLLIWIINRPNRHLFLWHGVILLLAFTMRYNALFYPLITIIALCLSPDRIKTKVKGLAFAILLLGTFILITGNKYKNYVGTWQYSPFSGWQIANNGMYAYMFIDSTKMQPVPSRFKKLDKMVRAYLDTTKTDKIYPWEIGMPSTIYMWDPKSPLQMYKEGLFKNDTAAGQVKKWATVAPLMKDYGTFLISHYPLEFAKNYIVPNAVKYYSPPIEFLEHYNMALDTVHPIAQVWFGYKSNKVHSFFKDSKLISLEYYPVLVGAMNIVFLLGMLAFYYLRTQKYYTQLKRTMFLASALWLINFGFSVFASPIALRFQLFPIIILMTFAILLVEFLVLSSIGIETKKISQETINLDRSVGSLTS